MSYRINFYLNGDHLTKYPALNDIYSNEHRNKIWLSYLKTIEELMSNRKKVILVLQAPELPYQLNKVAFDKNLSGNDVIGVPKNWWLNRNKYVYENIKDFPKELDIIDPKEYLCDINNCYSVIDGKSVYFDDNHLSIYGSRMIIDEIFKLQNYLLFFFFTYLFSMRWRRWNQYNSGYIKSFCCTSSSLSNDGIYVPCSNKTLSLTENNQKDLTVLQSTQTMVFLPGLLPH